MDNVTTEPQILADRRGVAFSLMVKGAPVECVIAIIALETHFGLERGASDVRILRTFRDGYARICAVAERKALARPDARVDLMPHDFIR
ncbi:hypothetical protein CIC12_20035 [Burkholderia sp. SG-MS1]|uniref:DUF1488 family protein n=1 Tax=Paraburkholderia sp. SG-MS1 TaxID=2023741 RepID=UPI0014455B08|nr:DUF1488 family protein [Paraburkholderia sp. SG-MS1]NKJ48988.1 hypothetical protein [Paraburkholderia sp. SG-MS1]